MNAFLMEVLQLMAASLGGQEKYEYLPDDPFEDYLPTAEKLRASASLEQLQKYVINVRSLWNLAASQGLIARLDQARALADSIKRNGSPQMIALLPNNTVDEPAEHLLLEPHNDTLGRHLADGSTDAAAAGNPAEAILKLRQVEDVLIRVLGAKAASVLSGLPMPETMALYRVEGDLSAPPSTGSLALAIPSGSPEAWSPVKGRSVGSKWPHLVWLTNASGTYATIPIRFPPSDATAETQLKELAIIDFMLQIAGLDVMRTMYVSFFNSRPFRLSFGQFWSDKRVQAGLTAVSPDVGASLWDSGVRNMPLTRMNGTARVAFMVTPDDPAALVSLALATGALLVRACKSAEALLSIVSEPVRGVTDMSQAMGYLSYHAGEDQFKAILVRALVSARDSMDNRYGVLRAAIQTDASFDKVIGDLKEVRELPNDQALGMLLAAWTKVAPWLATGRNLELLSAFVESVDGKVWDTWKVHRGNMSRYKVVLAFYQQLFP